MTITAMSLHSTARVATPGRPSRRRALPVLAAIVVGATIAVPASAQVPSPFPGPDVPRVRDIGPGKVLVASRALRDPNFVETVILLVDYGATGAVGLVLNRQTQVPLSRVFRGTGMGEGQTAPAYLGGPVEVATVQALVRSSAEVAHGRRVVGDVHVLVSLEAFETHVTERADQSVLRVFLGYAGWAPGQLEAEVQVGAWHIFTADADLVFDAVPETLWDRQIGRLEPRIIVQAPQSERRFAER
jgi:putative transcriptional regulator